LLDSGEVSIEFCSSENDLYEGNPLTSCRNILLNQNIKFKIAFTAALKTYFENYKKKTLRMFRNISRNFLTNSSKTFSSGRTLSTEVKEEAHAPHHRPFYVSYYFINSAVIGLAIFGFLAISTMKHDHRTAETEKYPYMRIKYKKYPWKDGTTALFERQREHWELNFLNFKMYCNYISECYKKKNLLFSSPLISFWTTKNLMQNGEQNVN